MKLFCIFLVLVIISITLLIFYFNIYNKLIIFKIKMDTSDENIRSLLIQKRKKMDDLIVLIKKVIKKKNYFKEFIDNKKKMSNIEYDKFLNEHYSTMLSLKEDNKSLNKAETNKLYLEINLINQNLLANKKFFNKNNNELMKNLKGFAKIIGSINKIKVKDSYEVKELIDPSL